MTYSGSEYDEDDDDIRAEMASMDDQLQGCGGDEEHLAYGSPYDEGFYVPDNEAKKYRTYMEQEEARKGAKPRNQPTYILEPVDEIPAKRTKLYQHLEDIKAQSQYQAVLFAHYSGNGAHQVRRELEQGKRDVPDGQWEFHSRKSGSGSDLYVRWLGE